MLNINPTLTILKSAIKFTIYGSLAIIILSLTVGLPFGGIYIAFIFLMRGFMLFFYLPKMLLIGASLGLIGSFTPRMRNKKKKTTPNSPTSTIGIIFIFALLILWVAFPHIAFKDKVYVDHSANWYFVDPSDAELPLPDWKRDEQTGLSTAYCDTELVLFVMEDFARTLFVCDQSIVDYLNTLDSNLVRITYEITYNHGDYRWASPYLLGSVSLEQTGWYGGKRCGGRHNHPCDSPQSSIRFIRESTWLDE